MTLKLRSYPVRSDEECDALGGTFLGPETFTRVIAEDADVDDAVTGAPVLRFRKHALAPDACAAGWEGLRHAAAPTQNRGVAAGPLPPLDTSQVVMASDGRRYNELKADGSVSKTSRALPVNSGIAGYYGRYPRIPYCRQTAYTAEHVAEWKTARPFIQAVDAVFSRELPERYQAQAEVARRSSPDFVIPGTTFSTITINRNWRTACHKDAGDLHEGFGVLSALEGAEGSYDGGYFIIPKYGVAVDLRGGDVLLADVHQWHGNSKIVGRGRWARYSFVFYFREGIIECGSAEEELLRAKIAKTPKKAAAAP